MSVDQKTDCGACDSPNWRGNLIFYLSELALERCAIQQNDRSSQWNGFGGSSVKYLHSGPAMAAEPPLTTIIGEGGKAIRSGIESQIKARMIGMDGGKGRQRLKAPYPLQ
jgi:hypothetical protein